MVTNTSSSLTGAACLGASPGTGLCEPCEESLAGEVHQSGMKCASTEFGRGLNSVDRSFAAFIEFGLFRFCPSRRLLLEGDKLVRLGGRALDLLIALLERPGKVVSKQELIARIWPCVAVEEGNLKVQIAALRRALRDGQSGHRYISTVNGRGYCFVAQATCCHGTSEADATSNADRLRLAPNVSISSHEVFNGLSARQSLEPVIAVVIDRDLARIIVAMMTEHQQRISSVGMALIPIFGGVS